MRSSGSRLRMLMLVALTIALSLATGSALAGQISIDYTPFDLESKKIAAKGIPDGELTAEVGGATCKFLVKNGEITPKEECKPFWQAPSPPVVTLRDAKKKEAAVVVPAKPKANSALRSKLQRTAGPMVLVATPSLPNDASFVYFDQTTNSWTRVPVAQRKADLKAIFSASPDVYANFDENGQSALVLLSGLDGSTLPEQAPEKAVAADAPLAPIQPRRVRQNWCTREKSHAAFLVCVDLVDHKPTLIEPEGVDRTHVIQPNRTTLVIVRHYASSPPEIEMQGEPGVTVSEFRGSTANADGGKLPLALDEDTSSAVFGPRKPGKANIVITYTPKADAPAKTVTTELIVETTYLGAVRFGVGTVFLGAADAGYEARSVNGSAQKEVALSGGGVADFELVLGAAPFLFDLLGDGPRPAITAGPRFAPYFGFGLVSVGPDANKGGTKVDFLKSVHVGLELEFAQNFSVAATFVIRRVNRLPEDLHIGSPISGDVPTVTGVGMGPGIVLNVSPDFLKLASKGSAGLFE